MQVTTPGSTANLGAGFDCLALAVGARFTLSDSEVEGLLPAEETHPAAVAHRSVGGRGPLWWRSSLPPGRGLGFSGAARVAGAALGLVSSSAEPTISRELCAAAFAASAELEGHPENAAASAYGGFVICAGDAVLVPGVDLGGLELLVWYPERTSSTDRSRRLLPETVSFADAVGNLSSAAAMVCGLINGDREAVRLGTVDHLHETLRLADHPSSVDALRAMRAHPAVWGAWLSGSGPTIAGLVRSVDIATVVGLMPPGGVTRVLDVGVDGLRIV